jgi:hypothetical protein
MQNGALIRGAFPMQVGQSVSSCSTGLRQIAQAAG